MFDQIHHQLMQWFIARTQIDTETQGLLVSKVATEVQETLKTRVRHDRLLSVTENIYEVFSMETSRNYVVHLDTKTCTCWRWQITGIPCAHALAVSLKHGEDPQTYACSFFRLYVYRATYANPVFPPNVDDAESLETFMIAGDDQSDDNDDDDDVVLPPNTRRPPGRPKKKRI
jgi:hypothetical protein